MNALAPPPPGILKKPPRRARVDQTFLPAALEILETPPSPIGTALIFVICLLATAALVWAYVGRVDVIATAQGKIQPTGRVKVIQPLETGRVAAVRVENGQHVAKGDPLVAFDSGDADADVNQMRASLTAFEGEAARRRAAIAAIATHPSAQGAAPPAIVWPEGVPEDVKARESQVLAGDLSKLAATVAGLDAQARQKQSERDRFAGTVAAIEKLVATLQQRVDMRLSLQSSGSGSKADLINATQALQEQQATLADNRGQMVQAAAFAQVLTLGIDEAYRSFAAENYQKLADAERQADEYRQRLAKALDRQNRTVLKSPIDGVVSGLSVTTVGQVVGAGDEIMRVVPDGVGANAVGIEIEAYLPNRDVGFVHPGQEAIVKIESLPFTRYGTVDATLMTIASDAIPEADADRREGDPTRATRDRALAGAQRVQNLVFPTIFRPAATGVMADGALVPLTPGMAVTVEVKTGSRRILEYLFSPLVEVASRAMKER